MLCFFNDSCVGSVEKYSRPVKAAGAEVGAQRRNQKLHAAMAKSTFWSENAKKLTVSEHFWKFRCRKIARRCGGKAHFEVKMYKTHQFRSTFWSSDVEKLHAAVAKHRFGSENVKKLSFSEHFLQFCCRKIARGCGETHIWKWKC